MRFESRSRGHWFFLGPAILEIRPTLEHFNFRAIFLKSFEWDGCHFKLKEFGQIATLKLLEKPRGYKPNPSTNPE